MKSILLSAILSLGLVRAAFADDVKVTITDVHMCCDHCVKDANTAIAPVHGATLLADKVARTVVITAPDKATAQKAADALVKAGFYGVSSDPDVKISSDTGAKGQMMQSVKIDDVHLCCPKCVKAVNTALMTCPGVTTNTATKGATSFVVTGNFNDSDVFKALQKAGMTGKEVQ